MMKCSKCEYLCDKNMHLCPKCRTEIKSVRVAQYGGVGGGNPKGNWNPGSSPNAKGMQGGAFNFTIDAGLDAIMGQTRKDTDDDHFGDANIESRLHQFHKYMEEDTKPYLPYKERQKLKEYENIQRREKFERDVEKAVHENSPAFVKEHFGPKIEHMIVLEDLLNDVRTNDEEDDGRTKAADDVVIIVDNKGKERAASRTVGSQRVRHTTTTVFGPHDTEPEDNDSPYNFDRRQFDTFPMGNSSGMAPMFSSSEVDGYLQEDGLSNLNGFLEEPTEAYSYPESDEIRMQGEQDRAGLPSPIEKANSGNRTTEQKLRDLKNANSPDRLPNDPHETHSIDNYNKEQEGLGTKYPSKGLQLGYSAPTPYM